MIYFLNRFSDANFLNVNPVSYRNSAGGCSTSGASTIQIKKYIGGGTVLGTLPDKVEIGKNLVFGD